MATARYQLARRRTYELFNARAGGTFGLYVDWFIMTLIAANVAAVTLGTVDSLQTQYGTFFRLFELVSVAVFTVEYLARIWSCTSRPEYAGVMRGRLRFAGKPMLVIDFLAILPFFLGAFVALDLRFLRALRLFRFFRLLKMARYSDSMVYLKRVVLKKKADLVVAFSANLILLLVASSVMYFLESRAQPEAFSSIPAALWWGVVTLTTVGYGDMHPITPLGKVVGAIVAMLGIGLFALPASLLASGFIEEARTTTGSGCDCPDYCPDCGAEIDESGVN